MKKAVGLVLRKQNQIAKDKKQRHKNSEQRKKNEFDI